MNPLQKNELMELVRKYALEIAPEGKPFILKSGAESKFYLDCRNLHLTPLGLRAVTTALWEEFLKLEFEAFGGPCVGADPIVGALTFFASRTLDRWNQRGFMVREKGKDHGKSGRIVGPLKVGDRCVLVEDVVTSGGSSLEAIRVVEEFGAKVIHVFAVVDRLAGGAKALNDAGYPFTALLDLRDLNLA